MLHPPSDGGKDLAAEFFLFVIVYFTKTNFDARPCADSSCFLKLSCELLNVVEDLFAHGTRDESITDDCLYVVVEVVGDSTDGGVDIFWGVPHSYSLNSII